MKLTRTGRKILKLLLDGYNVAKISEKLKLKYARELNLKKISRRL
jgi:DNA-binding CsgD family transcriptional regulator